MGTYVTRSGRVLRCAISTAASAGTLVPDALREIGEAIATLDTATTGALLLAGDGPHFCVGGDVRTFAAAPDRGAFVHDAATFLHELSLALDTCPVPVVAAVRGWATGAGMSLALQADVRVGGTSTRFKPAYPGLGFSPDGGMSHTLPRHVGEARAREILLTDATIRADRAEALGLLSQVVPDDDVETTAAALAATLADGPTEAYGRLRALVREGRERSFAEQLAAEADAIAAGAASPTGREGVDAFVAGRPPQWPRT